MRMSSRVTAVCDATWYCLTASTMPAVGLCPIRTLSDVLHWRGYFSEERRYLQHLLRIIILRLIFVIFFADCATARIVKGIDAASAQPPSRKQAKLVYRLRKKR